MENTYNQTQHSNHPRRKSKGYQQKLIVQKLIGLGLLAICAFVVLMAYSGQSVEDKDCTAILLFGPIAFYLLFTKEVVIY